MLLLSALLALCVTSPSEACASQCAGQEGTDRGTCLLQCEQQQTPRSGTGVTRWRREESLGGAPPGSPHAGEAETVTTTTTTTAAGTTTTTTTTTGAGSKAAAAKPASAGAPREDYAAIAKCMNGCDPQTVASARAQCKLGCLRLSVHWRAPRTRA